MDFSSLCSHGGLACFSRDGSLLAATDQNRLTVRNGESLQVTHTFTCLDAVQAISFSPDGGYILAAQYQRKVVQVSTI
jgi:DNA-binding beta-propeller fold protein YncE